MGQWQTKRLGELMDFIPTGSHSRDNMTVATDDHDDWVYNIHYGDIHTKYSTYVDFRTQNVPVLKDFDQRSVMFLNDGDLVVADASEDYAGVGSAVELKNIGHKKVIGGLHTYAMRNNSNELAAGYAGLLLQDPAAHKRLKQVAVYSKVFGVTKTSLSKIDVSYPEKLEQQRIVSVLEAWDEYLEALDKKITLKEQLKKGLMQQLLTGKMRLPEFHDEWHKNEIGKLLSYLQPGPFIVRDTDYTKLGTPVLTANKSFILGYTQEAEGIYTNAEQGVIIFDDFTMASKFVNFAFKVKSSAIKILYAVSYEVNVKFVFERMQLISTAIGEHKRNYISEYQYNTVSTPSPEEQDAIADVSTTLDTEIILLKQKKNSILAQKTYLLKNLLSGTLRTPENLQPKGKS